MHRVASTEMPSFRVSAIAALLAAGLSACAHAPAAVTAAPRPLSESCLHADSSAPPPDTVYAVGVPSADSSAPATDCAGSMVAAARLPIVVSVTLPPRTDLRDVLDRGLPGSGRLPDVVVTRDPEVLAYAARRGGFLSVPLAWDRTYVLIAPVTDSAAAVPPPAARDEMARDAVQADVRGAIPPLPWPGDGACSGPAATPPPMLPAALAYAAHDAIARQLAERVVALATPGARPAWVPSGLARQMARAQAAPRDSIANLLLTWRVGAAVTYYDRVPALACGAAGAVPPGFAAVPLVQSRATALLRIGSGAAFYVMGDGTLRMVRWRAGGRP